MNFRKLIRYIVNISCMCFLCSCVSKEIKNESDYIYFLKQFQEEGKSTHDLFINNQNKNLNKIGFMFENSNDDSKKAVSFLYRIDNKTLFLKPMKKINFDKETMNVFYDEINGEYFLNENNFQTFIMSFKSKLNDEFQTNLKNININDIIKILSNDKDFLLKNYDFKEKQNFYIGLDKENKNNLIVLLKNLNLTNLNTKNEILFNKTDLIYFSIIFE